MTYARPVGRALARVLSALVFLLGGLLLGLGLLFVIVAGIMWPGEYPIKFKSDDGEKTSADVVIASAAHQGDIPKSLSAWLN